MKNNVFSILLTSATALHLSFVSAAQQPAAQAQTQALTLRVAGSALTDPSGASAGNIEAISVNPDSGQIIFAMVALGYPDNRTTLTPIPWQYIRHRSDARVAGGIPGTFQQLTVPFSQQALRSAPKIDSQAMARATDIAWMTTSASYFAPIAAVGGVGATGATQTGTANSAATPNQPPNTAPTQTIAPGTQAPGTQPGGTVVPGTPPSPPGTVPDQGGVAPPANPVPPKVLLSPGTPAPVAK